ncbi:MAG: GTP 3',8-cyclase MoaA [Dehalococcoidia bacterium]|nr:GTP 3',8-cyclase MoaA [Dehalococcoidia bacterium]
MLTDKFSRPMRDLRISVTDRCNFRCPYCMPAEIYGEAYEFLPREDILTFEELTRLVGIFAELGIAKLRITGGEPLMRNDLPTLLKMLTDVSGIDDLTLTTNGYLLSQFAQQLKDAGLDRITVSLDSLDDEVFKTMNGRGFTTQRVLEAIQTAADVGLSPIKINCVVQKGVNDHTIVDLARHFKGTGHIVRYIEYMDVGNRNGWQSEQVVPADEIIARIDAEMPLEATESNYKGEVATRYSYKDGSGEIGLIASVTKPFCGDCTRVRLSTDGKIFTCLFASEGVSLMDPIRAGANDDDLRKLITSIWSVRSDRYSEERAAAPNEPGAPRKIEMYQIGG